MRYIWTLCGFISLLLGIIGVFLPVLPTTPFLLLTAYCWARGSQNLYNRLLQNRWLGGYIRDWREGRGVSPKSKAFAITLIMLSVGYSALFLEVHIAAKLLHGGLATLASLYILTRPGRPDPPRRRRGEDSP